MLGIFKKLSKQHEIQYIVQDNILKKQNVIINKLIRISLNHSNVQKAAQEMLVLIKDQYNIKNSSIFIVNKDIFEYLSTDLQEEDRENVKAYVNSIKTIKDIVIFDSSKGTLNYPSAEKRNIVYSMFIFLKTKKETLGALYLELDNKKDVSILENEVFKTVMESMTIALENLILKQKILEEKNRDQLTKLYNRNYLENYVKTLINKNYSAAMIDIDFFKNINDTYGHAAGDDVLIYVSSVLDKFYKDGAAFRVGGEEFLIIATIKKENLAAIVENLRKEIEEKELLYCGKTITLTISAGIATSTDGSKFEDVQMKADKELYRAKETGRNKVCVYSTNI